MSQVDGVVDLAAGARGDEDRMAELGHLDIGVGARRGDADLGPRLLQGLGRQPDVLVGEVFA